MAHNNQGHFNGQSKEIAAQGGIKLPIFSLGMLWGFDTWENASIV